MRVGIPKSLMYYRLFPLWKTFFEELGMEVVTSNATVRHFLKKGVPFYEDSCLPLKLLIPHAQSLVGEVDFLFLPRLVSLDRRYILCPKFRGAPDVLKLALKDALEIWDGIIDLREGDRGLDSFFRDMSKKIGVNSRKVRQAYRRGEERCELFNNELIDRINKLSMAEIFALETPTPLAVNTNHSHRHTVAFIGRPYNLFDPFINKDLLTLAKGWGVKIVTSHAIPLHERERRVAPLSKEIYWETSREIVGSILYFAEQGVADGIVFVTSFKCGIDALMQEFLKRKLGSNKKDNIPFMVITFDEHSTLEGIRTRLDAFLDLIDQRKDDGRSQEGCHNRHRNNLRHRT